MGTNLELAIKVFAALVVILVATTVCGRYATKVGQPRVVGEMVAGVLLGPSLLGAISPSAMEWLFPDDVKAMLYVISTIGLTFFMFLVGAGIDHSFLNRRNVSKAAALATAGIVPAIALGAGAAYLVFHKLASPGTNVWQFMLIVGASLSITAFPMLAHLLQERRMDATQLGVRALVAASIDDAVAWALLAVVIAVSAAGAPTDAVITIVGAGLFALVMLTVGRRVLGMLARRVERAGELPRDVVAIILLVVLLAGWITDLLGIFSVFGGFIAGVAMPQSAVLREQLVSKIADFNGILLLPVFFAYSGLNTHLFDLNLTAMGPLVVISIAAFAGKYGGCTLTARIQGMPWRQASAIGALMNARGLMILIFINIGLANGLIGSELFSMLVIVGVVTTVAAMPLYRASLPLAHENAEREAGQAVSTNQVVTRRRPQPAIATS